MYYYDFPPPALVGMYMVVTMISMLFSFGIVACQYVGNWFMFKKMGMPGWKGIIPYYSIYLLFEKVWDKKHFLTYIILAVSTVAASFFAYVVAVVGMVLGLITWALELDVHGYGNTNIAAIVFIAVLVLLIVIVLAEIGATIAGIVITFKLNNRLSHAFGKDTGFAAGLTFLSPIFTMILAFDKSVYLGRRM